MSDIVEPPPEYRAGVAFGVDVAKALYADEIAALRERVAELEAALREIDRRREAAQTDDDCCVLVVCDLEGIIHRALEPADG